MSENIETFETLIKNLKEWDDAYFNDNPLVSDSQYDQTKKLAQKLAPDHEYFSMVGSDVRGGKIDLPYPMGSLDQIYEGDAVKWIEKYSLTNKSIIISDKLDGVSCMLVYNDGKLSIAYSRGNGIQGADITRHVKNVNHVPATISKDSFLVVRGEIIMSNETFTEKYSKKYKNPRNMVAGCMNRKVTNLDILQDIDFIAYDVVDSNLDEHKSKEYWLLHLMDLGFQKVKYTQSTGKLIDDESLTAKLKTAKDNSEYELDGIVLTMNHWSDDNSLKNAQTLNPEHSVKYKVLDEDAIVVTSVKNVHWEISKSGYYKPRIEVKPVELFGTTVTFATGFNGKFISDNNIGIGTLVKITKSGSVIPYIVEVVKSTQALLPQGEWEWNDSGVEIIVEQDNEQVIFKQTLDFFKTLDVEMLKESNLKSMFNDNGLWGFNFEEICKYLFELTSFEWKATLGVNGDKIYNSLHRKLSNLTLEIFLGSLPFMGIGFGVRKAKILLKQTNAETVWDLNVDDVIEFDGFDTKTAELFVQNIPTAKNFLTTFGDYITIIEEETSSELNDVVVVMTGFRDKELKNKVESLGGRVTSAVSKKTTHLLTLDVNSTTGKAKKAKDLDIPIVSPEVFKDMFNL